MRPLHTEHIHVERRKKSPWLWLLLALVAIGLLAMMFLPNQKQETASTTQAAARKITFENKSWFIESTSITFPAGEVMLLGKSEEGDALYFNKEAGYKSGAGATTVKNTISTPSGRVYLKNGEGRYQPLFLKQ